MFCENCGNQIKDTQKFCGMCGAKNKAFKEVNAEDGMQETVKQAMSGSEAAKEKLYNQTYRQGFSLALQMVKNEQDALDIMQESYIAAFGHLNKLENPEKFKSWFHCIVANRCRDWLKKKKPQLFTELSSEEDENYFEDTLENEDMAFSPEKYVDYSETKRLMNEILDGLPEEQKLCVLMYYYEELSVVEIAEALDCSTGTVKSRLNYARKKIKADVEELERKGTKLYGVAPIPFIVWMLRKNETTISVPSKIPAKVVSQVAKTATKKGVKQFAVKAVAGILATVTVGTGGYKLVQEHVLRSEKHVEVDDTSDNVRETLEKLLNSIDYDYVEKVAACLPEYSSVEQLTDGQLLNIYNDIMQCSVDEERRVIPSEKIIEINEDENIAKYQLDAFDDFMDLTGVTAPLEQLAQTAVVSETYMVNLIDDLEYEIRCHIVDKSMDVEQECIVIHLEKTEYDAWGYSNDTKRETLVIVPQDNLCGYQIARIEGGYMDIERDAISIAKDISENADEVMRTAVILGDCNVQELSTDMIQSKLAYGNANDRTQSFDVEQYYGECELAGMSRDEAEINFYGKGFSIVDGTYEALEGFSHSESKAVETHFLRAELNKKGTAVIVYYLSLENDYEGNFTNFQKGEITLVPKRNVWGYAIQKHSIEIWDDTYSAEMRDKEERADELADYGDSYVALDIMAAVQQAVSYWEEESERILKRVEMKYPEYKDILETEHEKYMEDVELKAEKALEEGGGHGFMSMGRANATRVRLEGFQDRVYYYVGNFLMNNKIEIMDGK